MILWQRKSAILEEEDISDAVSSGGESCCGSLKERSHSCGPGHWKLKQQMYWCCETRLVQGAGLKVSATEKQNKPRLWRSVAHSAKACWCSSMRQENALIAQRGWALWAPLRRCWNPEWAQLLSQAQAWHHCLYAQITLILCLTVYGKVKSCLYWHILYNIYKYKQYNKQYYIISGHNEEASIWDVFDQIGLQQLQLLCDSGFLFPLISVKAFFQYRGLPMPCSKKTQAWAPDISTLLWQVLQNGACSNMAFHIPQRTGRQDYKGSQTGAEMTRMVLWTVLIFRFKLLNEKYYQFTWNTFSIEAEKHDEELKY